ncbi:MAG: hypothetical protein E7652_01390 [Ruminococcaceae bacterium]|nr:hypothetical protein [Oscillospiraceae bacterium]
MKKLLLVLLCSSLLVSSFTACSKDKKKDTKEDTTTVTETTVPETEAPEEEPILTDPTPFYGCWKYTNRDEWIAIYENGIYEVYEPMDSIIINREFVATEDGIHLPEQEGITLYFDEEGVLRSDIGDEFVEGESIFYTMYISNNFDTAEAE